MRLIFQIIFLIAFSTIALASTKKKYNPKFERN